MLGSINELVNSKRKSGRPKKIQTVDAIQKDKSCCSEGVNKKSECETPTQVDTSVNKLAQPINLVPSSIRQLTPRKNNTSKRTRTPTSLSPASIKYPSVVLSGPLMDLTLRPRGRPRKSDISTSTPLQQRTHLPSLTPKSTLLNGSGIFNANIETTTKGLTSYKNDNLSHGQSSLVTSDMLKLRPRGRPRKSENSTDTPLQSVTSLGSLCPKSTITNCSRFLKLTPVKFDLGSTATKQDTILSCQSSLLTADMCKLKGKMVTRQSAHYIDHGDPTFACESCGALLWHSETLRGAANTSFASYSICCGRGKVTLGTELKEPPKLLKDLIKNEHPKSASFIDNIRRYNSMFAFTSMAGHQDTSVNVGRGPYCYRLHGENYHLAGSLLPKTGKPAKFAQLYIYDTENEITNRIKAVSKEASTSSNKHEIDFQLTTDIRDMLDSINPLVKDFRMAGERIKSSDDKNLKLKLIGTRKRDGRDYNLPTASKVAALIVGDFDSTKNKRDIILHCQDGDLMRISELHPSYLAMQYPLFFPYAEDGYRTYIFHYGVTDYDEKKYRNARYMKGKRGSISRARKEK
ncbi:putative PIF1 DNA helicase/replication protein A1-like protein [Tanacetum coccineum]